MEELLMDKEVISKLLRNQGFFVNKIEIAEQEKVICVYGEVEPESCPFGCKRPEVKRVAYTFLRKPVRHFDILGYKTYLIFHGQEVECVCGRYYNPRIPFLTLHKHMTDDFAKYFMDLCKEQSCERVGLLLGMSGRTARDRYFKLLANLIGRMDYWEGVDEIGIDEISLKKGHKQYCLLFYDRQNGRVIDVLNGRTKELLMAYLKALPPPVRDKIKNVSIDMWKPYSAALRHSLPKARIVVDRFHVMQNLNKALDKCRKKLQKGLSHELAKELKKKLRWAMLKGKEKIEPGSYDEKALKKALGLSKELRQCYKLKESFRRIFKAKDIAEARIKVNNWIRRARYFGDKSFLTFVKTLKNWKRFILNFFQGRMTNGMAEGMNCKVKLVKRLGYGYENFENFRLKVLHACGSNLL